MKKHNTHICHLPPIFFSFSCQIDNSWKFVCRTNSCTGSPSSSIHSPDPATTEGAVRQRPPPAHPPHPSSAKDDTNGNLMWLVDFKLDFFNDIDNNDVILLCVITAKNSRKIK